MDSLRYATSAVGALFTKGRKQWSVILFYLSYVRPAFVNSYPGVCEAEGGADARAGGPATAPPSSPRCLSATTPPPPARRLTGIRQEPEHGRTDDVRGALAGRPIPILASIAQYPVPITGIVRTLKATASDK